MVGRFCFVLFCFCSPAPPTVNREALCFFIACDAYDFYRHVLMFGADIVPSSHPSGEWGVDYAIPGSEMMGNC